jgi:hypothetical protein
VTTTVSVLVVRVAAAAVQTMAAALQNSPVVVRLQRPSTSSCSRGSIEL